MNIQNLSEEEVKLLHALLGKVMEQPKPKVYFDPINQMIDDIMDNFDFIKVQKVMEALNWEWSSAADSLPTISELKKQAVYLLKGASKLRLGEYLDSYWEEGVSHSTGGFQATAYCDATKTKIIALDLKFILEEWDSEVKEEVTNER
jgi:hypothetical protein